MKSKNNYYSADKIELVHSGSDYFERIEKLILSAQHQIHLHTYNFTNDSIGNKIIKALQDAANKGVKIFLLCDSYGSGDLYKNIPDELLHINIKLKFFSPFLLSSGLRVGRRLHHKVIVVDANAAIVGGINISDDYAGKDTQKAWLDFAIYIEGAACKKLINICETFENKRATKYSQSSILVLDEKNLIRFRQSDYISATRQISKSYRQMIKESKSEIILVNAYFMPGFVIKRLLQNASKRGVKVKLMLSQTSDIYFMKRAMNHYYKWLLENNIEVYEYKPSVLHAKVAIFDNRYSIIGSYNLNNLSEYASIELNVDIKDENFNITFKAVLDNILKNDCSKVDPNYMLRKNIISRALDTSAYYLLYFSQELLFFFTRKDKVNELG
jgi:cardiolipin synthase